MKKALIFTFVFLQDAFFKLLAKNNAVHTTLFAPGFERYRWRVGKWRAWRTFERSAKHVPAYSQYLHHKKFPQKLSTASEFTNIPEIDKDSYIKKWPVNERCLDGVIPKNGVVVDESSGSSGTPTSWIRGSEERRATRSLLQVGFNRSTKISNKPIFVLNAFSLGAWATGMNVSASLTDVTIIKSIGPDRDKIINTIKEFGDDFTYVILSYPPFLKTLFDDERLRWKSYDIVAGFGGEGLSEGMRDHLAQYSKGGVFGSYGASDLEINIALETEFSVALRKAIEESSELADKFTKTKEYGILPMVFQYNPYDYVIETNNKGELVISIARKENISPRIRYNIHDRGHVVRLREIWPTLKELDLKEVMEKKFLDLPLLFHYGRSDLSVDYNGAVVAPDTVRDIINNDESLLEIIENHRLISYEDDKKNKQLHIALQLRDGTTLSKPERKQLAKYMFKEMLRLNRDFNNACKTSKEDVWPTLDFYTYRKGPFENDGRKLKNEYVWHLKTEEVEDAKLSGNFLLERDIIL